MNHFDREQLLSELLENSELADVRQNSLELGLASLRRRRSQARAVRGLVVLVPLALLLLVLLQPAAPQRVVVPPSAATASNRVKFITDEELLALFPNRSVALVGKPGQQQLVFLDQPVARR